MMTSSNNNSSGSGSCPKIDLGSGFSYDMEPAGQVIRAASAGFVSGSAQLLVQAFAHGIYIRW